MIDIFKDGVNIGNLDDAGVWRGPDGDVRGQALPGGELVDLNGEHVHWLERIPKPPTESGD